MQYLIIIFLGEFLDISTFVNEILIMCDEIENNELFQYFEDIQKINDMGYWYFIKNYYDNGRKEIDKYCEFCIENITNKLINLELRGAEYQNELMEKRQKMNFGNMKNMKNRE